MDKNTLQLRAIYKKYNPSYPTNFKKNNERIKNIFSMLNLPLDVFKKLTIGNFGCGTGEFDVFMAQEGHQVFGYDINLKSIKIANDYKKKFNLKNLNFEKKEFFNIKKNFDIVCSFATIHHLKKPYDGLSYLMKKVKKNGFLVVSSGLLVSNTQHLLMKKISRLWGDDPDSIYKNSEKLFKNHINRAVKIGHRKKRNVIYDQFVNPIHNYLSIEKIFKLIGKKFELYSCYPKTFGPISESPYKKRDTNYEKDLLSLTSIYWSLKSETDKKYLINHNILVQRQLKILEKINTSNNLYKLNINKEILKNSFNFTKLNHHNDMFFCEILDIIEFIKKKPKIDQMKKKIDSYKYLFKGTCGVGINYFVFKKND